MSSVNAIAAASIGINTNNAKTDVSLSLLKKAMNQSEENIMKIMDMSPDIMSSSKVDIKI